MNRKVIVKGQEIVMSDGAWCRFPDSNRVTLAGNSEELIELIRDQMDSDTECSVQVFYGETLLMEMDKATPVNSPIVALREESGLQARVRLEADPENVTWHQSS